MISFFIRMLTQTNSYVFFCMDVRAPEDTMLP